MSAVIGIDIAKATFDAYLDHESVSRYRQFANTTAGFQALEKWIGDTCEIEWICLEATGRYGLALSRHLHEAGYRISRVTPLRIKAFADSQLRRSKTDKSDVKLIAQFARVSDIPRWEPKSKPMSRLQQRTRHVQALKKTLQQEKNRLQSGLTDPVVTQAINAFVDYRTTAFHSGISSEGTVNNIHCPLIDNRAPEWNNATDEFIFLFVPNASTLRIEFVTFENGGGSSILRTHNGSVANDHITGDRWQSQYE